MRDKFDTIRELIVKVSQAESRVTIPKFLINTAVEKKVPLDQLPDVQRRIAEIEKDLGDEGRVLVRYSGTEAKARVMLEGPEESRIKGYAEELVGLLVKYCRA